MTEKNRIYESMTRVRHYDCVVRVWATTPSFVLGPRMDIEDAIKAVPRNWDVHSQAHEIAKVLDTLPDISAYEILDERGNGAIVYPDWK